MVRMKRFLQARRRIDPWAVSIAGVASPLYFPATVVVAGLFAIVGIYAAFSSRLRLMRHLHSCCGVVLIYGLWSLTLIASRGEIQAGNRQLGFMCFLVGLSFIAPGLCLVKRPLRMLIIGARVGVYLSLPLALTVGLVIGFGPDDRYNGGGNAAIIAFLVMVGAVTATMRVRNAPRYLPNGLHYLLIAGVPVFLTETRAVLVVLPVILAIEFLASCPTWPPKVRRIGYTTAAVVLASLALAPPIQAMVSDRFVSVYEYYVAGSSTPDMESGNIRLVMWKSAVQVIKEHPFTGVGTLNMFTYMKVAAGADAGKIDGYHHVHNFILQELLANGIFGLILMVSILASFLWTVFRYAPHADIKRCVLYFFGTLFVFGLLHDPLYHELAMSTTFMFLGVCLAQVSRWRLLSKTTDVSRQALRP